MCVRDMNSRELATFEHQVRDRKTSYAQSLTGNRSNPKSPSQIQSSLQDTGMREGSESSAKVTMREREDRTEEKSRDGSLSTR